MGRMADCVTLVVKELDDDLDTSNALRLIDDAAQSGYNVTSAATLLGITL